LRTNEKNRPKQSAVGESSVKRASLAAAAVLATVFHARLAPAQHALRNSIEAQAAAQERLSGFESQPYTFKAGDFRLLFLPSLGFDWNDNVTLSKSHAEDDFIFRSLAELRASYPVTQKNLLQLNVTVGYDKYFQHVELSRVRVSSGSELSFDVFVKDIWINLHDRIRYSQDSATEAAVANTAHYGIFQNTAGLSASRDLKDMRFSAGYDHQNNLSTSSQFEYRDNASEMVFARAGRQFLPTLTAGVEGTGAFTTYDQNFLNDSTAYSAGIYGDWKPGHFFSLAPRFGYAVYDFQQTSPFIKAENQRTWYFDVTARHALTDAISYSLSSGHEVRLGIESDLIDDWYLRPAVNWKLRNNLDLNAHFSYEHGKLSGGKLGRASEDTYDWYVSGLSLAYAVAKNVTVNVSYRLTFRASDVASRDYAQSLVGLSVTYKPK